MSEVSSRHTSQLEAAARGTGPSTRIDPPHPLATTGGNPAEATRGSSPAGKPEAPRFALLTDEQRSLAGEIASEMLSGEEPSREESDNDADDANHLQDGDDSASESSEQLLRQAGQLAGHLRQQQQALDRREAELNARVAQLERDLRTARLWLQEKDEEYDTRAKELERQAHELELRATELSAGEIAHDKDLSDFRQEYEDRQRELVERERQLEAEELRLTRQGELVQHADARLQAERRRHEQAVAAEDQRLQSQRAAIQETNRLMLANLERKRAAIEQTQSQPLPPRVMIHPVSAPTPSQVPSASELGEQDLQEQLAQLRHDRDALDEQQEKLAQQFSQQQQKLAESQRCQMEDLEKKREELERRVKLVDRRWGALEQMQNDITLMHRESLEMRLATEELWSQLLGKMAPAALTQSLGKVRAKLADHYRLAQATLAQQKEDIRQLVESLSEKQTQIVAHRQDLQSWIDARHAEIEQHAARLVAREQELDKQQTEFRRAQRQWDQQSRALQSEIRRLTAKTQRYDRAA